MFVVKKQRGNKRNHRGDEKVSDDEAIKSNEDDEDNIILGMVVKGTLIKFYRIPVNDGILRAINLCVKATEPTEVQRSEELDFAIPQDREEIITMLDIFHTSISARGKGSERRSKPKSDS